MLGTIEPVPDTYFTTRDGSWFLPTDLARGPWDPDACHGGPPAGLIARSLERLVPDRRLVRLTITLDRPLPMTGFEISARIVRHGRSVVSSHAEAHDGNRVLARAEGLHIRVLEEQQSWPTPRLPAPDFDRSVPGRFPIEEAFHDLPCFPASVEVRYEQGSTPDGGPTTLWMRTVPLLADEEPSGFQRLCPLADCGNGISYNEPPGALRFLNPDLTLAVFREPVGAWFASSAVSHWQPDGIGLADAELFDRDGVVGRAVQTLLIEPARSASRPPAVAPPIR